MGGEVGGVGWGVVVTERFVSQAPMGMSREEKDISLSKVRVKSPGRGILGIWFGAGNFLQTSRIPNSFVIASDLFHNRSMCLSVSKMNYPASRG